MWKEGSKIEGKNVPRSQSRYAAKEDTKNQYRKGKKF